jgi:hypothetical protein
MRLEFEEKPDGSIGLVVRAPISELEPAARLAGALEELFAPEWPVNAPECPETSR